jgi:uncharacterized protein (TIGR04255 family)
MTERPSYLPDYRDPPIDEMVIGVQFPPIPNFQDAHAVIFWQSVRQEYPRIQTQPRIEGPIESREALPAAPQVINFPLGPTQARTWLISEDDEYLIQIQNTRFIQNWRRRQGPYPHFEKIRDAFDDHFKSFRQLLSSEGLDEPTTQQVEVSYVNWITSLPVSKFLKPGSSAEISIDGFPAEPEDQNWGARYRLDKNADVIERLYVQCQAAIRQIEEQEAGYVFQLVYHAAHPEGISSGDVLNFASKGRDIIVKAFDVLTTDVAHAEWGKIQ